MNSNMFTKYNKYKNKYLLLKNSLNIKSKRIFTNNDNKNNINQDITSIHSGGSFKKLLATLGIAALTNAASSTSIKESNTMDSSIQENRDIYNLEPAESQPRISPYNIQVLPVDNQFVDITQASTNNMSVFPIAIFPTASEKDGMRMAMQDAAYLLHLNSSIVNMYPASTDGPNNAPAGYVSLTQAQLDGLKSSFPSYLYGNALPSYSNESAGEITHTRNTVGHPEMRLYNQTVLRNPTEHQTEFVLAKIGEKFNFAQDAAVIPMYATKRNFGENRRADEEREVHNDEAGASSVIRRMPTNYNYNENNRITTLVFTQCSPHNSPIDGASAEPTLLMHENITSLEDGKPSNLSFSVQPPEVPNLLTYFRADRYHSGPINPRNKANLILGAIHVIEPHHGADGSVQPVFLSHNDTLAQFPGALEAVDNAVNDIIEKLGWYKKSPSTELVAFMDEYKAHRHAYMFSKQLDKLLKNKLEDYFYQLMEHDKAFYHVEFLMQRIELNDNEAYNEAMKKAIISLNKQRENGKRKQ